LDFATEQYISFAKSSLDDALHELQGTARTHPLKETLARARRVAKLVGVTRLANVTGLDVIGIDTWMSVRPTARTLSVSQGKGLSKEAAQVSALMEAIELFHAELEMPVGIVASVATAISDPANFISPLKLPIARSSRFDLDAPISWVATKEIFSEKRMWLPRQMCWLDRTSPVVEDSIFISSSNGLASGNTIHEALAHALCELIERDQVAFWLTRQVDSTARSATKVQLASIDDDQVTRLVRRIRQCGLQLVVWYATTNIAVPVFSCCLFDLHSATPYPQRASGHGCHPDKGIALCRAISEAAQSRLTHISGSRDDMGWQKFRTDLDVKTEANTRWLSLIENEHAELDFKSIPSEGIHKTTGDALRFLQRALTGAGLQEPTFLDMTSSLEIPVCFACSPGLESDAKSENYTPGERMLQFLRERGSA
jgi:YcaO-like protein with predicted kinase domain